MQVLISGMVILLVVVLSVGGALNMMDLALAVQGELTGAFGLFDAFLSAMPALLFGSVLAILLVTVMTLFGGD